LSFHIDATRRKTNKTTYTMLYTSLSFSDINTIRILILKIQLLTIVRRTARAIAHRRHYRR